MKDKEKSRLIPVLLTEQPEDGIAICGWEGLWVEPLSEGK